MRTESAASTKHRRASDDKRQRMPRPGTRLRELWDLLHIYRGEVVVINMSKRFPRTSMNLLMDFYGCDIHNLGAEPNEYGMGRGPSRYVLAGEWFGREYKDYIAERLTKMEKPKC